MSLKSPMNGSRVPEIKRTWAGSSETETSSLNVMPSCSIFAIPLGKGVTGHTGSRRQL